MVPPYTPANDFGSMGLGCPLQKDLPSASEIDGGVGWAARAVRSDFDPTAFALSVNILATGRNRRLVRSEAPHGEFDFRALFLFGQAKRKRAIAIVVRPMLKFAEDHPGIIVSGHTYFTKTIFLVITELPLRN